MDSKISQEAVRKGQSRHRRQHEQRLRGERTQILWQNSQQFCVAGSQDSRLRHVGNEAGEVSRGQLMWTLSSRFPSLDLTVQGMVPCTGGFPQHGRGTVRLRLHLFIYLLIYFCSFFCGYFLVLIYF